MKTFNIYSLGAPPTFTLTPSDEGYCTERVSYELSMMLYLANQQGMSISVAEETDYTDLVEQVNDFLSGMENFMDTASSTDEFDWGLLPIIIEYLPLVLTGGWAGVFVLFVHIGIYVVSKWLEERRNGKNVGGGGFTEEQLTQLLERLDAIVAQEAVLTDYMGKNVWTKSHVIDGTEE